MQFYFFLGNTPVKNHFVVIYAIEASPDLISTSSYTSVPTGSFAFFLGNRVSLKTDCKHLSSQAVVWNFKKIKTAFKKF